MTSPQKKQQQQQKKNPTKKKIKPVHTGKVVAPGKLDLRYSSPFQPQQTCALNF